MFVLVLSLIVLSNVVSGNAADVKESKTELYCDHYIAGYYWKEYKGQIPIDAFPGGKDISGKDTYVGQAYMDGVGLVPVTIVPGCKFVLTTKASKAIPIKNVKILCSVEQDKLKWINTEIGEQILIRNSCPPVVGGTEANEIVHIGRANHEGETIVGKVFTYWKKYEGLHIPYNGGSLHLRSYQILTFDCKKYSTSRGTSDEVCCEPPEYCSAK